MMAYSEGNHFQHLRIKYSKLILLRKVKKNYVLLADEGDASFSKYSAINKTFRSSTPIRVSNCRSTMFPNSIVFNTSDSYVFHERKVIDY